MLISSQNIMEISVDLSSSLEVLPDGEPVSTVDYLSVPFSERIRSKIWECRSSAYEELLTNSDKSILFDTISQCPNVFLDESTVRGQESALRCIVCWTRGLVAIAGNVESLVVLGVLQRYGLSAQTKIKELVVEVILVIAERFGAPKALSFLSRMLSDIWRELDTSRPKDPGMKSVARGTVVRQVVACVHVLSALVKQHGPECDLDAVLRKLCDISNIPALDRAVRDACYTFFVELRPLVGDAGIAALPLQDAQKKEVMSRIAPAEHNAETSTLIVSPSLRRSPRQSRSSLSIPSRAADPADLAVALGKGWLDEVVSGAKWQDRRDAWSKLNDVLGKSPATVLPDEILQILFHTLKNDANVPITVEVCLAISKLGDEKLNTAIARNILSALILRFRDKTSSIQRSVSGAILAIVGSSKSLMDARMIEFDLKPILPSAKREVCALVQKLLPMPGRETVLLIHIIIPCLDEADLALRDMAILMAKTVLADASSGHPGCIDQCIAALRTGLSAFSPARRKAVETAIGVSLCASPMPRPKTATATARTSTATGQSSSVRRSMSAVRTSMDIVPPRTTSDPPTIQTRAGMEDASPIQLRPAVVQSPEIRLRRQQVERGDKWLSSSAPDEISSDCVAKLSAQWRGVLVAGSDRFVSLMMARLRFADSLRAISQWRGFIETDGPGWREVIDVIFKWVTLICADCRDNPQVWTAGLDLVNLVLDKLGQELTDREAGILLPVLADKLGHPALKQTLCGILDRLASDSDRCARLTVSHLCVTVLKSRNRKSAAESASLLLGWMTGPREVKCKRDIARTFLLGLSDRSVGEVVTVTSISQLAQTDSDFKQAVLTLLRTETGVKESHKQALVRAMCAGDVVGPTRLPLTDRTNISVPMSGGSKTPSRSRPQTARPSVHPAVSALTTEKSRGGSLVDACVQIQLLLDENIAIASQQAPHIVAAVTDCVRSVLQSEDSASRQSLLSLLHVSSRTAALWERMPKPVLLSFIRELLLAVSDKSLRSSEPEIWSDLNLSLVHAIANSDRPTAYSALLDLSTDPAMKVLAMRCIEKINRSLPQYLESEAGAEANMNALLTSFQQHIHSLLSKVGELAVIEDECVMACLRGICSVVGLVEVGEFVGLHVGSPGERLLWKKLLKSYSACEKRRKSMEAI